MPAKITKSKVLSAICLGISQVITSYWIIYTHDYDDLKKKAIMALKGLLNGPGKV